MQRKLWIIEARAALGSRWTWALVALTDEAHPGPGDRVMQMGHLWRAGPPSPLPGSPPSQAHDAAPDGVCGFAGDRRGHWSGTWSLWTSIQSLGRAHNAWHRKGLSVVRWLAEPWEGRARATESINYQSINLSVKHGC